MISTSCRHHLDIIWGSVGHHLAIIWASFGHHLDIIWGLFGHHLGIIWGPFVQHLRIILGLFRDDLGVIWRGFRDHLRIIWGSCSEKLRAGSSGGEASWESKGFGGPPGHPIMGDIAINPFWNGLKFWWGDYWDAAICSSDNNLFVCLVWK